MKKEVLIEVITALMILLFLYASFSKLVNIAAFVHSMQNQPFPKWFATLIVWTLPATEIAVSAMLVFEKTRLLGYYLFIGLMSAFSLYIGAILLHFFPYVPCTCGGVIQLLGWWQHLVFNLVFVFLAAFGLYRLKNGAISHKIEVARSLKLTTGEHKNS
ncbi:hypothetical protein KXD93_24130 [Mucilaginibacter sp. BJC16-A38]|uniref:DoxX family protein n=1 Tax=Mucilaginibacter phenanthrenivorans TaxID=1234842 RepID=UPI0021574A3F|nr:DoxX family protein [Mucilaginibacter phenanthrenivorans]MCR8560767.1 hypothetical protein [Mucilaginibacter phenanthrenivorans]